MPPLLLAEPKAQKFLSALLVYREIGRLDRGIATPEIILPTTAHAAFEKGAWMFGLKVIHAQIDQPRRWSTLISSTPNQCEHRCSIIASAANYAYRAIHPIANCDVSSRAGIRLHVDACLGGFILPFGEEFGYEIPVFDFRLPGITSISADTHKFGSLSRDRASFSTAIVRCVGISILPANLGLEGNTIHRGFKGVGRSDF